MSTRTRWLLVEGVRGVDVDEGAGVDEGATVPCKWPVTGVGVHVCTPCYDLCRCVASKYLINVSFQILRQRKKRHREPLF